VPLEAIKSAGVNYSLISVNAETRRILFPLRQLSHCEHKRFDRVRRRTLEPKELFLLSSCAPTSASPTGPGFDFCVCYRIVSL
jgi:hypothetical protein